MSSAKTDWLDDEFEAVRDDFLKTVKHPEKHEFTKFTTAKDVWDATEEIQRKQSKTKTLRGLNRIRPFLEALEQFSGTIEVFVQAKADILALIWGPIKFLLHISSSLSSVFEKVIRVLAEVGEALPLFSRYASLFKENQTVKHVLRLFYAEILELYKILISFMSDRRLKTCLEPFWPSVRSKVSVVEANIRHHKGLLTDHVMLEHILQSVDSRKEAMQENERQQEFRTEQRFATAVAEYKPADYRPKLRELLERSSIESGHWLSTNEDYNKWDSAQDSSCRCLWLQGIPGSGKTILTANTIHRMQQQSSGQVVFLFLTHDDQTQGRVYEVFASILFQMADNDKALKSTLLEETKSDRWRLAGSTDIQKITQGLLSSCGLVSVIIDGVDEIEEYVRKSLLEALLELLESCQNIKLLVSSRAERDIAKALHDRAVTIRIDEHNQKDIEGFINLEGKRWIVDLKDCQADGEMFHAAKEGLGCVQTKSDGMFLYAKLVLQLLRVQGTAADIRAEMESLPDGLDQAYDRILTRIDTKLLPTQKSLARKILSWLSCALRPLRKEELLQILVVEPGETAFRKGKRFNADISSACGPIVEVVDDLVRFVHFSAKEYITDSRTGFLELETAKLDAAVTCSSYLCHNSLDVLFEGPPGPEVLIEAHILSKDFVFFDYAANMWLEHIYIIEKGVEVSGSGLKDILCKLFELRDLSSAETLNPPKSMLNKFSMFTDGGDLPKLLALSYKVQGQLRHDQSVENDASSSSIAFRLFRAVQSFRTHIERLYCGNSKHLGGCHCPEPLRPYGTPTFFCEKPFCSLYKTGYPTRIARDQHMMTHQMNYKCSHPDCFHFEHGFRTQTALDSHKKIHQRDKMHPNRENDSASPPQALADSGSDDLALVLKDSIIHSDLDTIQTLLEFRPDLTLVLEGNFYKQMKRRNQSLKTGFNYCLCLAAWKSTPEVISYLLDKNTGGMNQNNNVPGMLATAIEVKNRDNIKHLLSLDAGQTAPFSCLPRFWEKALNNTRDYPKGLGSLYSAQEDAVSRSLSLWDPDLMEFLLNECQFSIPRDVSALGRMFSRPAIKGLCLEQVRDRFEQMRKFVIDPRAFDDGVRQALLSRSPLALRLCLENHGNPNIDLSDQRYSIEWIWKDRDRVSREMLRILLEFGAHPTELDYKDNKGRHRSAEFERIQGIPWHYFVQKSKAGESLEMIFPQ